MPIALRPIAKRISVIISTIYTFIALTWKIITTLFDVETAAQKLNLQDDFIKFLISPTTTNLAIVIGVVCVLVCLLFESRRKPEQFDNEQEQLLEKPIEKENHNVVTEAPPNIISLQTGAIIFVELENNKIFRECKSASCIECLSITLRNAPNPPHKIGKIETVTAHITCYKPYYPPKSGVIMKEVFNACWLNEAAPQVSSNANEIRHLIIGTINLNQPSSNSGQLTIYENNLDQKKSLNKFLFDIEGWSRIRVNLSGGVNYEYGKEFDFELSINSQREYDFIYLSDEIKQKRRMEAIQFFQTADVEGLNLLHSFNKNDKDDFVKKSEEWRKPILDFILKRLGKPTYDKFIEIYKVSEHHFLAEAEELVDRHNAFRNSVGTCKRQLWDNFDLF